MNSATLEVIRHSLNAASAALALLDTARPEEKSVVVEQVVVENAVIENAVVVAQDVDLFHKLIDELNGDYNLRTISELTDKLGIAHNKMLSLLDNNDVSYVTRQRRSDSAPLIGLASRN